MTEEFDFKYVVCGKVTGYNKEHAADVLDKRLEGIVSRSSGNLKITGCILQIEDRIEDKWADTYMLEGKIKNIIERNFVAAYGSIFGDLMDLIEKPKFFDRKDYIKVREDLVRNLNSRKRKFLKIVKENTENAVLEIIFDEWIRRVGSINCGGFEAVDIPKIEKKLMMDELGDDEDVDIFDCGDTVVTVRRKV